MSKYFCSKCGLEYRQWSVEIQQPACEECDPERFQKIRKNNITAIKKRTVSQEHITEHTWFPRRRINFAGARFGINWRKSPDSRRQQK
jgi:DNA-directed RNA polymerase subunit RPC12/RpoP